MTVVDSHCHLDDERFAADREAVIRRAFEAGVECLVAIGTGDGPPDLRAGIRLAEPHERIFATVGVHPHDAAKATPETWTELADLIAHPKVVGIGEVGLDYHYDFSPRDMQRNVFARQLEIARAAGKPVIIHTREAWEDTVRLVREHWGSGGVSGIMHCFSGGPAEAREALAMGFHLSFAGIVTFPRATQIHDAARLVPLDRLLVETDAPYLAPVPHRGKRNEPAFVMDIVRRLAVLRGETPETVAAATTANFRRLCLPADDGSK